MYVLAERYGMYRIPLHWGSLKLGTFDICLELIREKDASE
jgi:hypothetical protein